VDQSQCEDEKADEEEFDRRYHEESILSSAK